MMNIGISGVGIVSSLGNCFAEFKKNYQANICNLSEIERFDTSSIKLKKACTILSFDPKKYIPKKTLKKYDIYSRLGVVTAKIALESFDKLWSEEEREDMGIVLTNETQADTIASFLKDFHEYGPDQVSPRQFSKTAANTSSCHVAMDLGLHGPSINLGSKFTGGFSAIYSGLQLVRAERAKSVVVGSIDYLSQTMLEIYAKMKAFKENEDDKSGAYFPGEGAVSLVLNRESDQVGRILNCSFCTSDVSSNKWPTDGAMHLKTLEQTAGNEKIDLYYTSDNGDERVSEVEHHAYSKLFTGSNPRIINAKQMLGEFSGVPMFQIVMACLEPKGTKSLLSVVGPGGLHGGILVESTGWDGECREM